MKQIVFAPDWQKGNPYQSRLAQALGRIGVEISFMDIPDGWFPIQKMISSGRVVDAIHFHWINQMVDPIVWCDSYLKRVAKQIILAADILLARLRGIKIYWTIHNVVSHECKNTEREISARKIIAKYATHLFFHSNGALDFIKKCYGVGLQEKATVAPHGNYDNCYPIHIETAKELRARFRIPSSALVVLFFGAIRRYKGLEKLISAFEKIGDNNLRLIIAGNTTDVEFADYIRNVSGRNINIISIIKYIADEQVSSIFAMADIVALPFERTLTSGSATLAFTMGKALLVPEDARIFDFINDNNALFFSSEIELTEKLSSLEKNDLERKGKMARKAVEELTWDKSAELIAEVYFSETFG